MHYIDQSNIKEGIIKYRFGRDTKIVIIGDYGTGLSDSKLLLKDAILEK